MAYKKFKYPLIFRMLLILLSVVLIIASYQLENRYYFFGTLIFTIILLINLFNFVNNRFTEVDDFLESIKFRDFSRFFNETSGNKDVQELHISFNTVIKTIKAMNSEKEVQYIYLRRILEMVDTGIITYNTQSGKVLLVNNAFKTILDVPEFKKVSFLQKRKPDFYTKICIENHPETTTLSMFIGHDKLNVLVSDSLFKIDDDLYKIIAVQNIDDTIDHTESEAWKKLLSVMTHEIMNSISPISSLAETLQGNVRDSVKNPKENPLNMEDLEIGIESIKKRSEGLMMFAKTYRSLHKITQLNLSTVIIADLFDNIKHLLQPSLKNIKLEFHLSDLSLNVDIDRHLIEQVLINLILNAIDATEETENAQIDISASVNLKGQTMIQVQDNGAGIPDEILDSIFVPFFTTKKNGSGIGLSLSKQIMLLHKGKIKINSAVGKGSLVMLVFN
jgi:nitrogen fixation/metabolism regulation signal transduction histidine kinase